MFFSGMDTEPLRAGISAITTTAMTRTEEADDE